MSGQLATLAELPRRVHKWFERSANVADTEMRLRFRDALDAAVDDGSVHDRLLIF